MQDNLTLKAILQLEETLIILEESLQENNIASVPNKKHIARLKQFYSPLFDFEHSESGSYYHATLQCIKYNFIENEIEQKISLSPIFIKSLLYLLEINTLSLDTKRNNNSITEALINLSDLWGLHEPIDMADLIIITLAKMRHEISNLLNDCIAS